MKIKITKQNILQLIGFPLLFVAIFVVIIIFWEPIFALFKDPQQMKERLSSYGILAPLIFIGLQILQVVIFIIPGEVPQIAGGYLFGILYGIILSTIGIAIGSALNFLLARLLGIPFVKLFLKQEQMDKISSLVSSHRSQLVVFFIFLIPGLPIKDILSYIAGLSPMKFFAFLLISMMGRLPGIIGSSIMGSAAAKKDWILLIVVFVIASALFIVGFLYKEKILHLMKKKSEKTSI